MMGRMDVGGEGRRPAAGQRPGGTAALTVGLVAAACVLAVAAHVSLWLDRAVLDTAAFTDSLAPLSDDDEVTDALAASLTDAIDDAVRSALENPLGDPADASGDDPPALTLPPAAAATAEALGAQVRTWVEEGLRAAFAADAFDPVWRDGVEGAHRDFLAALDDPDAAFTIQVTDVLVRTDEDLEARGLDLLDDQAVDRLSRVTVLRADQLGPARAMASTVDRLGPLFPWLALLAAAGALAVAPHRRRTAMWGGVAVAAAVGLATVAERWFVSREVRKALPADRPVASAAWDALGAPLDRQALVLAGAALAVAAGAWLLGRVVTPDA
jgi:hypothetical protein